MSRFGIYIINIGGQIWKVGKADLKRITQSTGLPTRIHQQLRKLGEKYGKAAVDHTLKDLGRTTTAEAKAAEKATLQKIFEDTRKVPPGNQKSFKPGMLPEDL